MDFERLVSEGLNVDELAQRRPVLKGFYAYTLYNILYTKYVSHSEELPP